MEKHRPWESSGQVGTAFADWKELILFDRLAWETGAPKMVVFTSLSIPSTSEVVPRGLGAAHGIPRHLTSAPPRQPAALQYFPQILSHRINFTQKFARF